MIAAASPFMKTLRNSFSPAASPGRAPTTSTGIPSGPKISAKRSAPSPDASAGVRRPVLGTTPTSATSTNWTGSAEASSCLSCRGSGVQVGVEDAVGEGGSDADRSVEGDGRRVEAENDVGAADRVLAARGIRDSVEAPHWIPAAHHASRRREIGRDPAAGLAEAEHRDLDQSLPSTISRRPLRS